MIIHNIKVYPSKIRFPKRNQLAWKIAEIASDNAKLNNHSIEMAINRIIDNASVAIASLNRSSVISSREMAIKHLRKNKIRIEGPFASDTIFLKENSKKFDVIFGMYHDQVLGPMKTLYGFKAINITLGLPFLKITPDHGPNYKMLGKNQSDPSSIFYAFDFLNKIK